MDITITTNVDDVIRTLQERGADLESIIAGPLDRGAFRIESGMKIYPEARPESTYTRTGTYGRRWTTQPISGGGWIGRQVGNNTDYGPFIGSAELQAGVHRGTWPTDEQVIDQEQGAIVADFEDTIIRALG